MAGERKRIIRRGTNDGEIDPRATQSRLTPGRYRNVNRSRSLRDVPGKRL